MCCVGSTVLRYRLKHKKVGVLLVWIVKSYVFSVGPLLEKPLTKGLIAHNIRLYYPYRKYTNLFIFQFITLRQTLLGPLYCGTVRLRGVSIVDGDEVQ